MNIHKKRNDIRQELVGAQQKRIFLVEGADDKNAFGILLSRFSPGWEQRWAIACADNKRQLLGMLALEPDWIGVTDRDEWDDATVAAQTSGLSNLIVLPRFCLENYLVVPTELWQAIPLEKQSTVDGGYDAFEMMIQVELERYVRHGALWRVVTPLWAGLRALGFKEFLASDESIDTAQNDTVIQQTLENWSDYLNADRIYREFQTSFQTAQNASRQERFTNWIHGKVFFAHIVTPALNRLFGQTSSETRMFELFRTIRQPADLADLFHRLF